MNKRDNEKNKSSSAAVIILKYQRSSAFVVAKNRGRRANNKHQAEPLAKYVARDALNPTTINSRTHDVSQKVYATNSVIMVYAIP